MYLKRLHLFVFCTLPLTCLSLAQGIEPASPSQTRTSATTLEDCSQFLKETYNTLEGWHKEHVALLAQVDLMSDFHRRGIEGVSPGSPMTNWKIFAAKVNQEFPPLNENYTSNFSKICNNLTPDQRNLKENIQTFIGLFVANDFETYFQDSENRFFNLSNSPWN